MRLSPRMKASVSARLARGVRVSQLLAAVADRRRAGGVRPVTSATRSAPNRSISASSAVPIGGSAQSCSISSSRARERRLAVDRPAVLVRHRLGARIALGVGEHLHLPGRESGGEIVDHIFARAERSISSASRSSGLSSASRRSSIASAVETSWTTTA